MCMHLSTRCKQLSQINLRFYPGFGFTAGDRSWITGPKRQDYPDGPEEFHLVILDNGRSRMLADPEMRESLYCIRCGACLNICPV